MSPTDPLSLINSLDPDAIRARLDEMDCERAALLTLLRSALALRKRRGGREERKAQLDASQSQEVGHAAS